MKKTNTNKIILKYILYILYVFYVDNSMVTMMNNAQLSQFQCHEKIDDEHLLFKPVQGVPFKLNNLGFNQFRSFHPYQQQYQNNNKIPFLGNIIPKTTQQNIDNEQLWEMERKSEEDRPNSRPKQIFGDPILIQLESEKGLNLTNPKDQEVNIKKNNNNYKFTFEKNYEEIIQCRKNTGVQNWINIIRILSNKEQFNTMNREYSTFYQYACSGPKQSPRLKVFLNSFIRSFKVDNNNKMLAARALIQLKNHKSSENYSYIYKRKNHTLTGEKNNICQKDFTKQIKEKGCNFILKDEKNNKHLIQIQLKDSNMLKAEFEISIIQQNNHKLCFYSYKPSRMSIEKIISILWSIYTNKKLNCADKTSISPLIEQIILKVKAYINHNDNKEINTAKKKISEQKENYFGFMSLSDESKDQSKNNLSHNDGEISLSHVDQDELKQNQSISINDEANDRINNLENSLSQNNESQEEVNEVIKSRGINGQKLRNSKKIKKPIKENFRKIQKNNNGIIINMKHESTIFIKRTKNDNIQIKSPNCSITVPGNLRLIIQKTKKK